MDDVRVTVITPVKHYSPAYLRQAVGSILGQSRSDWRLLVVAHEERADELRELLRAELSDARIELIVQEGRRLAGAINTGMRRARTPFVALLLGDDLWSSDAVAVLNEQIARHPEVDFFHSSRAKIDEGGRVTLRRRSRASFRIEEFQMGSPVKHLLCWRRALALQIGGVDEALNCIGPDDYDFPWSMAEHGARFHAIEDCLYFMRNHCDHHRLTTHTPLSVNKRDVRRILRKHGVGFLRRRWIVARRRRRGSLGLQSVYRNALDRWIKQRIGYEARRGWSRPPAQ
jgi:glycosyltransferase involved in cell wall biosynthesis